MILIFVIFISTVYGCTFPSEPLRSSNGQFIHCNSKTSGCPDGYFCSHLWLGRNVCCNDVKETDESQFLAPQPLLSRLEPATQQGSLLKKLEKDTNNNTVSNIKVARPPGQRPQPENDFQKNGTVVAIPPDNFFKGISFPVPVPVSVHPPVPVPVRVGVPLPVAVSVGRGSANQQKLTPTSNKTTTKIAPGYPIPANKPDLSVNNGQRTTLELDGSKPVITDIPSEEIDNAFGTNTPVTDIPSEYVEIGFGSSVSGNKALPTDIPSELIGKEFSVGTRDKTVTTRPPYTRRSSVPAGRTVSSSGRTASSTGRTPSAVTTNKQKISFSPSPPAQNGYGIGQSVTDIPSEAIEAAFSNTADNSAIITDIPSEEIEKAFRNNTHITGDIPWKTTIAKKGQGTDIPSESFEGEPTISGASDHTDIPSEILEQAFGSHTEGTGRPSVGTGKSSVTTRKPTAISGKPSKGSTKHGATVTDIPSEVIENALINEHGPGFTGTDLPSEFVDKFLSNQSNVENAITRNPSEPIENGIGSTADNRIVVTDIPDEFIETFIGKTSGNSIPTDIPNDLIEKGFGSITPIKVTNLHGTTTQKGATTTEKVSTEAFEQTNAIQVNPDNPYQVQGLKSSSTERQTTTKSDQRTTSKYPSLHVEGNTNVTVGIKNRVTTERTVSTSQSSKIITDIPSEILSLIFGQMNNRNVIKTTAPTKPVKSTGRPKENGQGENTVPTESQTEFSTASTVRCGSRSSLETDAPPVLPVDQTGSPVESGTTATSGGCDANTDIAVVLPLDTTDVPAENNEIVSTENPNGIAVSQTIKVVQPEGNNGYGVNVVWQQPSVTVGAVTSSSRPGRTWKSSTSSAASRKTTGTTPRKIPKLPTGIPLINPQIRPNKTTPETKSSTVGGINGYGNVPNSETVTAVPNAVQLQTTNYPTVVPSFAKTTSQERETAAIVNGISSTLEPAETITDITITSEETTTGFDDYGGTFYTEVLNVVGGTTSSVQPNPYGSQKDIRGTKGSAGGLEASSSEITLDNPPASPANNYTGFFGRQLLIRPATPKFRPFGFRSAFSQNSTNTPIALVAVIDPQDEKKL